jgi:hypothetical protein
MHAVNHNELYRGHLTTRATIHDSLFWHTGLPYTASDPWPSLLTRACILSWRHRGCAVTVLRRRRSGTRSLSKRSRTRKQGAIQSRPTCRNIAASCGHATELHAWPESSSAHPPPWPCESSCRRLAQHALHAHTLGLLECETKSVLLPPHAARPPPHMHYAFAPLSCTLSTPHTLAHCSDDTGTGWPNALLQGRRQMLNNARLSRD